MDRPKLSRDRILEAALDLVDRVGIAKLTMRALGAELGVEAMTLYHYLPSKSAVLDGLVELVTLRAQDTVADKPGGWREWLRDFAVSYRTEILRHPALLALLATRPVMTPASLRQVESSAAALCGAGFTPQRALQVLTSVSVLVLGQALAEAGRTPGQEDAEPDTAGLVLDDFPVLAAAIAAGVGTPGDHEARFHLALDALLAGLEVG